jgi:hypothetical protein
MNWPFLAGSLVSILALAAAAHWLDLGGDARIDRDEAVRLAEEQGFAVADVALDRAGLAALVRDAANNFMLVRRHGAHFVAHPLRDAGQARLDHRFLSLGKVTLDLGDQAGVWAANLRRMAR